jgi:hypothetical protein
VDGVAYKHPSEPSGFNTFLRALTCYVEEGVSGYHTDSCKTAQGGIIETKQMPEAAKEGLTEAKVKDSDYFEYAGLTNWLNTWSYSLRENRRQLTIIPNELSEFLKASNYKSWEREVVDRSRVKHKTRIIYRSPSSFVPGISVAETHESITGDVDSPFIEAEIAVDRLDGSGNADFYSYNSQGQLSTTSMFPNGERPVPEMCLGCHFSKPSGTFGRSAF